MRWLLLVLTTFAFLLCFTRHSAGAWGFWLPVGVLGIVATTLAFVQAGSPTTRATTACPRTT